MNNCRDRFKKSSFHFGLRPSVLSFVVIAALFAFAVIGCKSADKCSESEAMNKMLAFSRVFSRIATVRGSSSVDLATQMTMESGAIHELIAAKKYGEACDKADELAKKYNLDLNAEAKGMVTFEELQKDGGKRGGECSLAEAAQRHMEFHGQL